MNRPLALIQGDLALPNARLLRGLPPPYGVYRWPARAATQRRPQPMASTAAQQAIQDAVRRWTPLTRHSLSGPGQKFRFFYKLPQPRDYSARLDAELAEARHYLEMDKTRERSSRSDYVLGATIFVACGIVLVWLLTTCSAHDADKAQTAAITRPAVVQQGAPVVVDPHASARPAQPVVEVTPTVAQTVPAPADPAPKAALRSEPTPSLQAALPAKPALSAQHFEPYPAARASTYDTATGQVIKKVKAERKMAATRLSEAQVDERLALNRSIRPATRAAASTQPEWTARSSAADATTAGDATGQAVWLDWAAQQQRRPNVTARAGTPALAPTNADWNAHLTQRRITDNPTAFQAPNGQN
ncbi:hypothetical protein LMG28614_04602 [Paraburkholderia ultramafica]|uniref:Transmembrane protein n=1 Tax=Paraburkholderia ultramafica TaxID=1544867 RepID=A0A6S7BYV1_9BURK|nr:hypothetical protein [Paraburkholderia ultramafica]CAB3797646.1 hypothetical protein LMG28614_04602 [Paraburkholderia ultramafica]